MPTELKERNQAQVWDAARERERRGNQRALNECKSVLRVVRLEIQVYTEKGRRICRPKTCLSSIRITLG